MKKNKIIFWIATIFIFLFEGVVPVISFQSREAKEGIGHLGYPEYFGIMLTVFKVLGALALIIPRIPPRIKEWAYAGFAFDFIAASVSNWVIDGPGFNAFAPYIALAILIVSYIYYHKIKLSYQKSI